VTNVVFTEARRPQRLVPLPIVVDADVLLRNVDYCVRKGWTPRLLESASPDYTLFTGIVLFATARVLEEVERHLGDIAVRRDILYEQVVEVWNQVFLPRVRFVELRENAMSDPRVDAVRALHANDTPTAALAVALAPCIVLTDNRKHFLPLGLPDRPTDEIAVEAHALSKYLAGANAGMFLPTLTGAAVIEGSKKVVSTLGREGALLIGLIALGGAILYWRSESGGRFRESVKAIAREVGPPLMQAVEEGRVLSERVSALAIEPTADRGSALTFVAQTLATGQTVIPTVEIARRLRDRGYRFSEPGGYRTLVRAWLLEEGCFFETRRGHWSLGYHARELPLSERA
jgi:predicted nucleic acid-binding protein